MHGPRWGLAIAGALSVLLALWQIQAAAQGLEVAVLPSTVPPITIVTPAHAAAGSRPLMAGGYTSASGVQGIKAHCDLVVAKNGQTLEVIGGNVRNSVSKASLELDTNGRLQSIPRRPWFVILQNRL